MATKFQLVIDCADPERMVRFWTEALGYVTEPPPEGFESWTSFRRSIGLPDEENYEGHDSIIDPRGSGPRIWFQQVADAKQVKNRLHIDIEASGGRGLPLAERKRRVDRAVKRLVERGATRLESADIPGLDHYAVPMLDPEGNEFDVN